MTGYGRSESHVENFQVTVEVKTLNSKFLDLSPRLPKELASKEADIRSIVSEKLSRGKVMLTLELSQMKDGEGNLHIDESLFKAYYHKIKSLAEEVDDQPNDLIALALHAPDVIKAQELSAEELPIQGILNTLEDAIQKCQTFRRAEGKALTEKLQDYIRIIRSELDKIEKADEHRASDVRARLLKGLAEIQDKIKVDENRMEQEIVYYLEKLDISEEKVRLTQHLNHFEEVLLDYHDAGKKLGFIAQEMGREINTIGSKANNASIQRMVVNMKDELEKIKEQTLNLL